jgi:8-oxo-dGTP diphosphatase
MARDTYDAVLAANIRASRVRKNLDQAVVVDRMRALGFTTWHRQTMGKVERGERRVTGLELFGLALAMEVSIPLLTTASDPDGFVELPNGQVIHSISVERLAGRGVNDHAVQWGDGTAPVVFRYTHRPGGDPFDRAVLGSAMTAQGWPEEPKPAAQPVVAAIIVSDLGVLVGRRNDRTPPWTFIAGEQEPGESPADTIIRETKEETGLEIEAGEIIGQRVHPATGRTMVYMSGRPVRGTKFIVGDEAELAEVRWVDLTEADELLPDMFGPVREYLASELGEAGDR